ncbi:MAG: TIGR03435 family protein [Terracidiphilus sp.]
MKREDKTFRGTTIAQRITRSSLRYSGSFGWRTQSSGPVGAPPSTCAQAPPPDASGPSIFTAIQEQLGLKLESTKGPVEALEILHIEKPSENW